jgi:hypothetical protein
MRRIYVAGPYSADNVMDVLRNIGRGQQMCSDLFIMGFAPFCPWHDRTYVIDNPQVDFTVDQFYQYGLCWLEVCDAVYVIPDSENSKGVAMEIEHAQKLGIPVFYSLIELQSWGFGENQN